jgi:dienelactone hydrolase
MRLLAAVFLCVITLVAAPQSAEEHEQRRQKILANMQLVMGTLPDESKRVPLDVRVLDSEKLSAFTRKKITFAVEKGDRVFAYLLIPNGLKGKTPAVLCLHQTTAIGKAEPAGVGGKASLQYAAHLAERGYITLAPDYPNFGDYKFDAYTNGYASATMKGIWNHMRAVDLLQSLPEVDPGRIGCMGHSLGGHNTLFLAAFDPRVKVAVTNCGFTSFTKYYGGNLTGWAGKAYMPRIATVYNKDPKKMPFDFPDILAAISPRPLLAIAPLHDANFEVSGVKDCIAAAGVTYELLAAKEKLAAVYPDCEHDFPDDSRKAAYEWMDRWLKQ